MWKSGLWQGGTKAKVLNEAANVKGKPYLQLQPVPVTTAPTTLVFALCNAWLSPSGSKRKGPSGVSNCSEECFLLLPSPRVWDGNGVSMQHLTAADSTTPVSGPTQKPLVLPRELQGPFSQTHHRMML